MRALKTFFHEVTNRTHATSALMVVALLGIALTCATTPSPTVVDQVGGNEFQYPPVVCSNPCVIEYSPGGIIDLFEAQGRELKAEHTPIIVDGFCASACTILVDIARDDVCLTRNVILAYHKSSRGGPDGQPIFGDISFETPGLNAYIKAHGGLPNPDSGHLLMLNFSEARAFYKPCAGAA